MSEVVYAVEAQGWIPKVIREGDQLQLKMGVDFNRGHDIREFHFALTEQHLAVLRTSLARHLILWCVLQPLAEHAGREDRNGKPNKKESARAIDVVLLGTDQQVEAYVAAQGLTSYQLQSLIAHGGDPTLIGKGRLFEALEGRVQVAADWRNVREYWADEARAEEGVHLAELDKAVLYYTNRRETWSGLGGRRPEQVPAEMLEAVLALVRDAEGATADLEPTAPLERWQDVVGPALRATRPELLDEPIRAIASLVRSEAPDRAWRQRQMPALGDIERHLQLHVYDAQQLALIAETTPEASARPWVEHVGGELFVGVDRRIAFATYEAVTEDDMVLWEDQEQVTFAQLIAAGVAKAEVGKHVARDGTCWISHADLAAAVLVDPKVRATIIESSRLPITWPEIHTLVPNGDLVVAALSRLRFVMTGSRDEDGMLAILKAAREAITWGRDHISPHPLVWRHGQWLPFDWAAEFPHLADRIKEVNVAYADAWLDAATQ
ncbi:MULTISPECIES: DUF6357 family protein [unclassified Nocardioides]|uniref:DUF6357 family protein n=1 Tax=unclassified Nocardioides TaxID=2615069 RepID=UPI0006F816F9|nr:MULTISPECIES: DUF6357 family protein [unclassified Nocardioides]KQY57371.1 hypothetical protein ASD30_14250 [Nocardioides sp. Root140]KQZ68884.1 hypothetical protein ASD66_16670 [Nocardioides sp. Root151]KRF20439.1 hypothetical protein ASH02_22315 [Nocardioides sp. Soil796]